MGGLGWDDGVQSPLPRRCLNGALHNMLPISSKCSGCYKTLASFLSLSISSATDATMTPPLRLAGSSTLRLLYPAIKVTPRSCSCKSHIQISMATSPNKYTHDVLPNISMATDPKKYTHDVMTIWVLMTAKVRAMLAGMMVI